MPIDGVFSPQDYDPDRFGTGATPRVPDGGVELARANAILSQWLRSADMDSDGAPEGWELKPAPEDEGYDVYLGKEIASQARYNTSPIDPLDDSYQYNKGVTGGGRPPNESTPDIAKLVDQPETPVVALVDPQYEGYPTGTYLAAKSIVGKGKKAHTKLTPTTEFTISASEGVGKALEWQASQDLGPEAYGEGLWLSAPVPEGEKPDPSTIRLQAVRPKGGRTYTTRGPLKLGSHARTAPNGNETKVGQPKRLKWGRDMRIRGGLGHDLQPMRLKVGIVVVTAIGESMMSTLSDPITIPVEREGHGVIFHPKHLHPDASGFKIFAQVDDVDNPGFYQLIRVEKGDKFRRFAMRNRPVLFGYIDTGEGKATTATMPAEEKPKMGATELAANMSATTSTMQVKANASFPSSAPYFVKVGHEIVRVVGGANTNNWTVQRAQVGTKAASHATDDKVVEDDTAEKLAKLNEHQNRHFWLLAQADPPTEDGTGIENPTGDIDAPIPVGLGRPGEGTWWVSYSRRFNGRPTQASKPVRARLIGADANKVIELRFPPRVNKVNNALYGRIDQKGLPTGWTFRKQDGTIQTAKDALTIVGPGKVRLDTSGAPTANDRNPKTISCDTTNATTIRDTSFDVDPDRVERIRCTLEVTARSAAGRGYVEIVQFADGVEIGTLTLGTLDQNGVSYIDKTVAGPGYGADLTFNAATTSAAIRWGIENGAQASRNLKVSVYNLFWHPFNAQPRRFAEREHPEDLWEPSNDASTPVPASHVLAIGRAPDTPGDAAVAIAPLNSITHSTGGVSVGAGSLPSGWTTYESNPGANSQATIEATTLFTGTSQNAALFRSDGTQAINHNFFARDYSGVWAGASSLAMRFLLYIERLPTKSGCSVQIAAITTASQAPMAWLQLWHDGTLELHTFNFEFFERVTPVRSGLRAGDLLDLEIIVGGGGTNSGIASTYSAVNNGPRVPGGSISGVDWFGTKPNAAGAENSKRFPRRVMYGGFQENKSDQKWTLRFDEVVTTYNGYAATLPPPPPGAGATPQPDRPYTGGAYRVRAAADGGTINQGYAFYLPSDALEGVNMGHEVDEFYVKPGVQRTAAIFMKIQDFPPPPHRQRIFVLAAYNENGDRVELGCLSEQTGANAVLSSPGGTATVEQWYEFWMTYTPPVGYFRCRWEHEGTYQGTYVWQEPVDAPGNLNTLALRDAARVNTRASTATFSVLLEARVPGQDSTNMENGWLEQRKSILVSSQVPDELQALSPEAVTWRARSSDRTDVWSAWETDEDLIPDYKYVDLEITMRGDGIHSPVVPAGGASVVYSTYQPILLRENRTALPGGALVGGDAGSNLPRAVNRHDYDTEAVGGLALARAVTDRRSRLGSFGIRVYTPEAEDEIAANMIAVDNLSTDIAEIVDWFIEDWYENLYQRIRFYAPGDFTPEVEFDYLERRAYDAGSRRIPRVMEVEQAQVLEAHFLE